MTKMLKFIDLNSPPVIERLLYITVTTKKLWRKKKDRSRLEKSIKNDNIDFRNKRMTKWKLNLKSIKSFNVSSYYGKNLKVTRILIIIAVIIGIIVKMKVMLYE